jgi:hypothetical protein
MTKKDITFFNKHISTAFARLSMLCREKRCRGCPCFCFEDRACKRHVWNTEMLLERFRRAERGNKTK